MLNRILLASVVGAMITCAGGVASAQVTDTDNTAGWPDAGAPPQTSAGSGTSFGGVVGATTDGGVENPIDMEVDSDTTGRVRFRVDQVDFQCFNDGRGEGSTEFAVMYIDSVPGGFNNTNGFTDFTGWESSAVSGGAFTFDTGDTRDADLTFPSGFFADYAVVYQNTGDGILARLYRLRSGATHLRQFEADGTTDVVATDDGSCSFYEFVFDVSDIGLSPGGSFRWFVTAVDTESGDRADEYQGHSASYMGDRTTAYTVTTANSFTTVGEVLINEMDSNTPGTDTEEFIELSGPPGTSLDGTVLVFWNGSSDSAYRALDLDGESLDADGYFVYGNAAVSPDVTFPDGELQNGPDGVGFYVRDFPPSTTGTGAAAIVDYSDNFYFGNDWIDGVMDGFDSVLEAELLATGETGANDFASTSLQRCGPGRGVQSAYLQNPGFPPDAGTPGADNNCSICGDGTVDPIWEECEDTDGLPGEGGSEDGGPMTQDCCDTECNFLGVDEPYECREGFGVCDVPEFCSGTSGTCPADDFLGPAETCREAAGPCDVAETCNGLGPSCPANGFALTTTVCRPAAGLCDAEELCTGSEAECPPNLLQPMGTTCRGAAGDCDVAEACTGTSIDCPADALAMMGAVCRVEAGDCDVAETCDGSTIDCPADGFLDSTTVCRMATDACDVEELCTGSSAMCPMDMLAMDGASCDDGTTCNGSESCMGGSCMSGTPLDCDDSNACTTDMCSEPGGCSTVAVPGCCNIDGDCDDGDICTADVCSGPGGTCSASPITGCCEVDADCDDMNACTTNTCDTSTNRCTTTPVPDCCMVDDDCNDMNACTTDSCDASTGSCVNDAVAGCCMSDGDCSDGDTCTMDTCDTATNTCANDEIAGCCTEDGDCDDGDECTTDMCDTATAMCFSDRIMGCGPDADAGVDGGLTLDAGDTGDTDGGGPRDAGTGTGGGDGAVGDAGTDMTDGGCACRASTPNRGTSYAWLLALGAIAFWRRRRRR